MRAFRVAVVATLILAAGSFATAAAEPILLPEHGTVRVLPYAEVAVGHPAAAAVLGDTADFRAYNPKMLSGWPVDAWLRFHVAARRGGRWLLHLPETEWAELYTPDGRGGFERQITGTDVAFNDRSVPDAIPSFVVDPANESNVPYYLHVRYHPGLPFAPTLRDTQTYVSAAFFQRLIDGLFIGVLLTIIALGLYIVVVLRYRATGLFTIYLIALLVNELITTGLASQYLWPGLSVDARLAILGANTLAFLSFLLFVRTLLSTRAELPRLDTLLLIVFVAQIVVTVLQATMPFGAALILPLLAVELFGIGLVFTIAILRWRQGSKTAIYFVFAFLPAALGAFANIAYDALLPAGNWFWAANGVEFGTMLECVMMSAIVLNRINLVHRERLSAKSQLSVHAKRNVELRQIALTDPLTGVANRLRFYDELGPALAAATERKETLGVLYVDLDDFKEVNDVRGHLAGDEVLRGVAYRLIALAREQDLVARLGGDEFGVLLRHLPSASMLDAIRDRVTGSFELAGTSVSVGASLFPRDATTPDGIVDAADRAMYQAKQARKAAKSAGHALL